MTIVLISLQIIVALLILNVWILRPRMKTQFRGGGAKNMREEFAAYGLPFPVMCLVGGLKIAFALALLAGIWIDGITYWAAIGLGLLMLGAFAMHLKIKDPIKKSIPSVVMLALCIAIVLLS